MTTTEDQLMPAVRDLLAEVDWPASVQNPRGVRVLFGAYRAIANVELVAVTGLTNTTIESNREERITFDVSTLINIAGYDELRTWERRTEITSAVIDALMGSEPRVPESVRATGVYHWWVSTRETSVEPAADIVAGSGGWVGYSLLTIEATARPCC